MRYPTWSQYALQSVVYHFVYPTFILPPTTQGKGSPTNHDTSEPTRHIRQHPDREGAVSKLRTGLTSGSRVGSPCAPFPGPPRPNRGTPGEQSRSDGWTVAERPPLFPRASVNALTVSARLPDGGAYATLPASRSGKRRGYDGGAWLQQRPIHLRGTQGGDRAGKKAQSRRARVTELSLRRSE